MGALAQQAFARCPPRAAFIFRVPLLLRIVAQAVRRVALCQGSGCRKRDLATIIRQARHVSRRMPAAGCLAVLPQAHLGSESRTSAACLTWRGRRRLPDGAAGLFPRQGDGAAEGRQPHAGLLQQAPRVPGGLPQRQGAPPGGRPGQARRALRGGARATRAGPCTSASATRGRGRLQASRPVPWADR